MTDKLKSCAEYFVKVKYIDYVKESIKNGDGVETIVLHILDKEGTGNAYNVSIPEQKSFSDMSVCKSELNKVIYGILDSLETKGSKPIEVYRR